MRLYRKVLRGTKNVTYRYVKGRFTGTSCIGMSEEGLIMILLLNKVVRPPAKLARTFSSICSVFCVISTIVRDFFFDVQVRKGTGVGLLISQGATPRLLGVLGVGGREGATQKKKVRLE